MEKQASQLSQKPLSGAQPAEPKIYFRGEIIPQSEARVSVYDRCYLYGDGIFESIPVWKGVPFKTDLHFDRLFRGMNFFRIESPLTRDELKKAIADVIAANDMDQGYLRVQVSRGEGEGADNWNKLRSGPYFMIYTNPLEEANWIDSDARRNGRTATVLATRRTPSVCKPSETKDCNFLNNIVAAIERASVGADLGILLDMDDNIAEGISYNVFIVRNGVVHTPTLRACLPGITRQVLLQIAPGEGLEIRESNFGVYELITADEVCVVSSIFLGVPVTEIDGRKIGNGKGGPITRKIGEMLIREMERESQKLRAH